MIVAKTDLNEIPERCARCNYSSIVNDDKGKCICICFAKRKTFLDYGIRQKWCPLINIPSDTKQYT